MSYEKASSFERQQLWKEHSHPIILRQSALKAAQEFAAMQNLQLSLKELMALTAKFEAYYETGDTSWMAATEKYLEKKTII